MGSGGVRERERGGGQAARPGEEGGRAEGVRSRPTHRTRTMADYHSTMRNAIAETTEWEDLQVKHGNWEKRELQPPPPKWAPNERQERQLDRTVDLVDEMAKLDAADKDELSDLEDDFDDDRFLAKYREARMEELKERERVTVLPPGHGEFLFIKRDDFVREVSEAGDGKWVVCHLYQDANEKSQLMQR